RFRRGRPHLGRGRLAFAEHEAEDTRAIRPDALVVRRGHAGAAEEALEEEVPGVIEERRLEAERDAWSEARRLRAGEADQREPGVSLLEQAPMERPERIERNAIRPAPTSGASGRKNGFVANVTPGARPGAWSPWRITNVSAPPRSIQMPSSNALTFGPARSASKATWPSRSMPRATTPNSPKNATSGGVPGAWSPVTAIRRRTTVPMAAVANEAKAA